MAKDTNINLRNQVIYQIFTRNYKEGTFKAVESDLDRIKALGVDIIYLLPIQPSGEVNRKGEIGSPYAIKDYREIDPMQGTLADFESLCESVHAKGMKIIIDVVYNHTSPDSWLALNHPEWFYHKEDGSLGNRIGDWWDVIDLDYSNMDLWDYQIDTLKMWAKYVDGFRCDVAPIIPIDFWIRARQEVAKVRKDAIWIAESVEPEFIKICRKEGIPMCSDCEMYEVFDICYDYDIYGDMVNAIDGAGTLKGYLDRLNAQEYIYPSNYIKLRNLENHDRSRIAAMIPDEKILRNWTAFNYFLKGVVMIYAGQEVSATHHPTLFDMDTVSFDTTPDISDFLSRLAKIKENDVFRDSSFESRTLGKNDDIIIATHTVNKGSDSKVRRAWGVFSTSGNAQSIRVDLENGTYVNEISKKTVDVYEKTLSFDGEPIIIFEQ